MKEICEPLILWYQENKRDLPWRNDKNPYHVWISEIMLQQTKIEAVKKYYERFMSELPTIESLSSVSYDRLLKLWEGLGYYNRARNLAAAATKIMNEYHGIFPQNYDDILSLPGIGVYTAGAISSICFNTKAVAVDGNVLRVYMRLTNCDDNILEEKVKKRVSAELLDMLPVNSGDFNEGMMELGEVICKPQNPSCDVCPIQKWCQAYKNHTQDILPTRIKNDVKSKENLTVFLLCYHGKFALSYRNNQNLLKNLWEFPNVETRLSLKEITNWLSERGLKGSIIPSISHRHIFTHKIWNMDSYLIYIDHIIDDYTWASLQEIKDTYALPTAFQPFVQELERTIFYEEEN